jgi:hypothetical protein
MTAGKSVIGALNIKQHRHHTHFIHKSILSELVWIRKTTDGKHDRNIKKSN